MNFPGLSWIRRLKERCTLRENDDNKTSMMWISPEGSGPVFQEKLAPDGVEFLEDKSEARWVEESLSKFARVRALVPEGFSAYARMFHPAYLEENEEQPVRWSTVASWTGRTVHPLMQFERVANLSESHGDIYKDPPWGLVPRHGSIPVRECRILLDALREFTSTPDRCYFGLWDGYGYLAQGLYKESSRVRAPGRKYLLFRGPIEVVLTFLTGERPFWGDTPNIWWPEDRAWCVATDIDLYDTYVGGSDECIEAILTHPELEALPATLDARIDLGADIINAPKP